MLPSVFKELGTELPADFIEYSCRYGTGCIFVRDRHRWEMASACRPTFPDYVKEFFEHQDSCREGCDTSHIDLALYPEEGGLLPFGNSDSTYFAWRTKGHPDDWNVVKLFDYDEDGYRDFDMNFSEFMGGLVSAKLQIGGICVDWNPKKDVYFEPDPKRHW